MEMGQEDIGESAAELKWNWAGHSYRRKDNRWSKDMINWQPMGIKR